MTYNAMIVTAYFISQGLPRPKVEFVFSPTRKFRFDFAWPDKKVALEVEGGIWTRGAHGRGAGIQRDMEKGNVAVCHGWRVLRVVPKELAMLSTIELLRVALTRFQVIEIGKEGPCR